MCGAVQIRHAQTKWDQVLYYINRQKINEKMGISNASTGPAYFVLFTRASSRTLLYLVREDTWVRENSVVSRRPTATGRIFFDTGSLSRDTVITPHVRRG